MLYKVSAVSIEVKPSDVTIEASIQLIFWGKKFCNQIHKGFASASL